MVGEGSSNSLVTDILFRTLGGAAAVKQLNAVKASGKQVAKSNVQLTKSVKDLTKDEQRLIDTLGKADSKFKQVGKTTERYKNQVDSNTKAIQSHQKSITKSYSDGTKTVSVTNTMTKSLDKNKKMWLSGIPAVDNLNKSMNELRWTMVNVGFVLMAAAAVAYPFVKLAQWGMETELLFKRIEVVSGVSAKVIKENIESISKNSIFSLEELGESYLEFTKQGFSAADAMRAMPAIQDLAIIGFTDLATATEMVAQMMHQFSLDAGEAERITSVLAKAANLSAADVETFGVSMSYAGPLAAQAGLSFEETAASLAILSNTGLGASKAGTSFAAMMTQMISPSDKAVKIMRSLGISFFTASGEMKDMTQIVAEFGSVLELLPDEQKTAALVEIFQTRGSRSMSALTKSFNDGEGSIKGFTAALDDSTYAMEKAAEISDTTSLKMKEVVEGIKTSVKLLSDDNSGWVDSFFSEIDASSTANRIRDINVVLRENEMQMLATSDATEKATASYEANRGKLVFPDTPEERDTSIDNIKFSMMDKEITENMSVLDRARTEQRGQISLNAVVAKQNLEELIDTQKIELDSIIEIGEATMTVKDAIKNLGSEFNSLDDLSAMGIIFDRNEVADYSNAVTAMFSTLEGAGAKVMTDVNRAFENGALTLTDIVFMSKEEQAILEKQGNTQNDIDSIISDRASSLINVINGQEVLNDLSLEERQYWRYILQQMVDAENHLTALAAGTKAVNNITGDLVDKYKDISSYKQFETLKTVLKDVSTAMEEIAQWSVMLGEEGKLGEQFDISEDLGEAWSAINSLKTEMEDLIPVLEQLEDDKSALAIVIKETTRDLKDERAELSKYKAELKEVNKLISNLTSARYEDQTATEKLMAAGERWLLQQKLSDRGIGDAQAYIQQMLARSTHGYELLYDEIMNVDSAVANSKTTYDSWVETVSEFIRQTVSSGNQMATNVSGAITKYQTLLLSTSKFDDSNDTDTDKYENVEEVIRNLSDAYKLYYGEMEDDVKFAAQEHEEAANGIYDSSGEVIDSLQEQWEAQAELVDIIKIHQDEVNRLTEELAGQKTAYDDIVISIDKIIDRFDVMVESAKEAARAIKSIESTDDVTETSSTDGSTVDKWGNFDPQAFLAKITTDAGTIARDSFAYTGNRGTAENLYSENELSQLSNLPAGGSVTDYSSNIQNKYDDFVMRPGQKPIAFSGDDTLVGMKDTDALGGSGVQISNINISGVSGDANEFAYQFAESLRRELRAI